MVAVTKTAPASDIRLLAELGITDIGENKDQEASRKYDECADDPVTQRLTWHFVGQLQSKKARSVTRYADVLHSVDRSRLVSGLDDACRRHGRTLTCLLQVRLDLPEEAESESSYGRGGIHPSDALALADRIAEAEALRLGGVMAVAPYSGDPRPAFERLLQVSDRVRSQHPAASWISAGMSDDLQAAIEFGATHVRVGRGILGERAARR